MASNRAVRYLLTYDIADPRRLQRVHRRVSEWGIPLQYSVFIVRTNTPGLNALCAELSEIINTKEDDIRIYPLPQRLEMHQYGNPLLPDGVELIGGDVAETLPKGLVR